MQKRKTLVNALVNGGIIKNREEAEKMLGKLGIDVKIRGERLTLEEYEKIEEYLDK